MTSDENPYADKPNAWIDFALTRVKDPTKLAFLQAVARERGLLPTEPNGEAARGETFLAKNFPSKPEPF